MAKKRGPLKDPIVFTKVYMRRASIRWYARSEVIKRCQVARGLYKCEICGAVGKKDSIHVDHINPVVDVKEGDQGLDTWVKRLLVSPDELQGICKDLCHRQKTDHESAMRAHYRKGKPKKQHKKKLSDQNT